MSQEKMPTDLQNSISAKRYLIYKEKAEEYVPNSGKEQEALCEDLYIFNMEICSSLYIALNMLEVCYRNSLAKTLSKIINTWTVYDSSQPSPFKNNLFYTNFLNTKGQNIFRECLISYTHEKSQMLTSSTVEDYLISNLSFGFWVHCLNATYLNFWTNNFTVIFPNLDKYITHQNIKTKMFHALNIRNDVMHHSCLLNHNLQNEYDNIINLIRYISPKAKKIVSGKGNFRKTLESDPRKKLSPIKEKSKSNYILSASNDTLEKILTDAENKKSDYIITLKSGKPDKLYDLKSLISTLYKNITMSDNDSFIIDNKNFISEMNNAKGIKFDFINENTKIKSVNKKYRILVTHDSQNNITGLYFRE
ncbi:hypothetical protein [Acetobacter okinawensis]|uniref:hypothetical protein n=1 Tax=Acetobacter okinawensis TaxID=1076594 RepID=UPI001178A0D3|nr:hypothetical protein [Acetobacter okinawensis]